MTGIKAVDIASRGKPAPTTWPKCGAFFTDYDTALEQSSAELVYISLPNAAHEQWALKALACGKHVVVDKPAMMTLDSARKCLDLAKQKSLLLAEATVFAYHPHIAALQQFVADNGPHTQLDALFVIPPLPAENFRNSVAMGGGCVLDMGPYAAGLARLFGDEVDQLHVASADPVPGGTIDTGFSILAKFANGLRYTGHFSFESEYQNRLTVVAAGGSVVVDRLFSPAADMALVWRARIANQPREIIQPPADMFQIFLKEALQAIRQQSFESFATALRRDAEFRALMQDAIEKGQYR